MKRVAVINALSGVAQIVVNIGLLLVTVPVFINRLGIETYGVYALITAIGSLGVFTNFGFNTSLIKYLAEQEDRRESNYDIVVTFIIIGGATLLVALFSLLFSDFILVRVLNLAPDAVNSSIVWFYVACVTANVFQMLNQVPSAVLDSKQKVYITNGIQLSVGVVGKTSILASLIIAPSLMTIGWIMLATSIIGMFLTSAFAHRIWGRLRYPELGKRFVPVAKKHFTYGRSIYGSVIMGFFYEPATKVLISRYVGLTEVGYFDIAFRVKGMIWGMLERLLYPVLPLFASKRNLEELRTLVEEVQHKLIVIVAPVMIATVFLSSSIITLWLGIARTPVIVSVILIVDSYLIALIFVPLYQFLMVKGHPQKTLVLQSVNVGVNIALFASLVPWFGYYGAVSSFCLAVFASTALCAWYQWSLLHSTPIHSKEFALRLLTLGGFLTVVNVALTSFVHDNWLRVFLLIPLNGIAIIILLRWLKMVTPDDVERYVGRGNRFGVALEKLLVQGI